jgi:tRNA-specific adenosine deaminase 3
LLTAKSSGSLFNHSYSTPNTNYMLDKSSGTIRYILTRDVVAGEELLISYGIGKMWWEKSASSAVSSGDEDLDDDDSQKLENELYMLGQLGIDGDEREARPFRRKEDRRKHALTSKDASTFPSSTPAAMSSASTPPIIPPKSVGPSAAPLWRITAAVDPTTTPLELMAVWAVDIDPRKSANFIQFSRSIARRLRAAEEGGDGQEHIRLEQQQSSSQLEEDDEDDDSGDEDESMKHLRIFHRMSDEDCLSALVCRVQDVPSLEKVTSMLEKADVVLNGSKPRPFQIQAPKYPAPSRLRLPEWKAYWPVAVKHGRMLDASAKSSLLGISISNAGNCSTTGIVDRGADARMWTSEATQWAVKHFTRCLTLAKQARERGELPVGVHVTPSYSDIDASVVGPDGHPWIEVDAWDTRQSERNPIKHGVTNAIRDVAKIRSDRDRERLQLAALKVANGSNKDLSNDRHALTKAVVEDSSAGRNNSNNAHSNGQDYLLNNLTLFTTHEPCVSCCMALVHSRVRSIFFIKPSPGAGGCCGSGLSEGRRCIEAEDGGPYAIQEQDGLNHHFDVWKWVGDSKQLTGNDENIDELLDIHNLDA